MKKTKIANETRQNNGPYIANGYAENHINENNNNMENERQNVKNSSNEFYDSKFRAENNSNCCDGCENDLPSEDVRRQLDRPPTTSVEKLIKKLEDCRLLAAAEQNAAENPRKSENSNFGSTVSSLLNVSSTNSGSRKDENLNSNLTGKGAASVVAKNIVEAAVDFVENMVIYSPESEEISIDSKLAEKRKLNLNKKADENSLLPNNADDYALIDGSLLNTREIFAPFSDDDETSAVRLVQYKNETQMPDIMRLITKDLSEPYSIYTYRYFIHNWPHLCFLAKAKDGKYVGAIVCKLSLHARGTRRGYIAMLAVDEQYRRLKIGTKLVTQAIEAMIQQGCDEVVLETEVTNKSALKLYENLGFVRDKRLFRYYLNGVDAFRLKLWLKPPQLVQYL